MNGSPSAFALHHTPQPVPYHNDLFHRRYPTNLPPSPVFLANNADGSSSPYASNIVREIESPGIKSMGYEGTTETWPRLDSPTTLSPFCVIPTSQPSAYGVRNHTTGIRDIPERGKRKRRNAETNGKQNTPIKENGTKERVSDPSVLASATGKEVRGHSRLGSMNNSTSFVGSSTSGTMHQPHNVNGKIDIITTNKESMKPSQIHSNYFGPPYISNTFNKHPEVTTTSGRIARSPTLDVFMKIHNSRKKHKRNGSGSVLRDNSQPVVEFVDTNRQQEIVDDATQVPPSSDIHITSQAVNVESERQRDRDDSPRKNPTTNGINTEQRTSKPRNFDKVNFGTWQIKTWYIFATPSSSVVYVLRFVLCKGIIPPIHLRVLMKKILQ